MDWSNGMSGELLRVITLCAGSGCTVVWTGGSSSSAMPQPSSTRSTDSDSNRPVRLEAAPRVLSGLTGILYGYTATPFSGQGVAVSGSGNRSMRLSAGNHRTQSPAIATLATPPTTTAGFRPHHAAVKPDSNSPSSFEAPMNTAFTALTRPRISSGVSSCTSMWRMYTLIMSEAPMTTSAASETKKSCESPNTTVAIPNAATPANIFAPTWRVIGRQAIDMA